VESGIRVGIDSCCLMQIEMATGAGGQLVDSLEEHWWSQTGLYKFMRSTKRI
jgi:hypothetical protein